MPISWQKSGKVYKSPLRVILKLLQRSRETKERKCEQLKRQLEQADSYLVECKRVIMRRDREIDRLGGLVQTLSNEARQSQNNIRLPDDPPIGSHGYGPRIISLSVNLAKAVGFRGARRVLGIFLNWLDVEQEVPDWTTIRSWMQRLGVDALKQPIEKADDWIWLVDHSNQSWTRKGAGGFMCASIQASCAGQCIDTRVFTRHRCTTGYRLKKGGHGNRLHGAGRATRITSRHINGRCDRVA